RAGTAPLSRGRPRQSSLEADWNERLRYLDALQREHERQRAADQGCSARRRAGGSSPSQRLPSRLERSGTPPIERKRIVALLIEDVTLVKTERISIHVRFRGDKTTSLTIDKPKPIALIRKTLPEAVRVARHG